MFFSSRLRVFAPVICSSFLPLRGHSLSSRPLLLRAIASILWKNEATQARSGQFRIAQALAAGVDHGVEVVGQAEFEVVGVDAEA